jgi:hypothetical protein
MPRCRYTEVKYAEKEQQQQQQQQPCIAVQQMVEI